MGFFIRNYDLEFVGVVCLISLLERNWFYEDIIILKESVEKFGDWLFLR